MRWNLHSNACDVLGLGPRTAGQLATVGIRTVSELLAASADVAARRLRSPVISASALSAWQIEARLILELPNFPAEAARFLAAAGVPSAQRIRQLTPTEILALLETAQKKSDGWLATTSLPTVSTVSDWILLARDAEKSYAA